MEKIQQGGGVHLNRKKMRWIAAAVLAVLAVGVLYRCCAKPGYTAEHFNIPTYRSEHDEDGDGVDDQTDVLQGAKDYVKTKPKYKSEYYEGGYPDDGYGVCTDVVGQAMRAAGYDLRELVDADIRKNPAAYGIDRPDDNIDFRRVPNLNVYFQHTAISLTTDVSDIAQWQGGDIVVFPRHIGIVSDRRNADCVPYVIHHASPAQRRYEEDILSNWDTVTGHYRVS